jgi:hypothetical protein
MAKKKHKTPEKLDYLFERRLVTKATYKEFWSGYWGESGSRNRSRFVDNFVSELQGELPLKRRSSGTITISIKAAREQAQEIGGYVVRRNAKGRFSKTGHRYQAIARGKRK